MKLGVGLLFIFLSINLGYGFFYSPDGSELVEKNVKIYFSPSLYEAFRYNLGDFLKLYHNEKFGKDLPTVIYIHGFLDTGERDFSAMAIRAAYRERNDHNIVTVDWAYYSKSLFYSNTVIPQLKIICETIALNLLKFIDQGYDIDNLHLVGHSLGAQCGGLVSRHLKKLSDDRLIIPRIFALDPAAPGFEENNFLTLFYGWVTFRKTDFPMISSNDAKYVQIIHTSSGSYGIAESRGHVDFFPNFGANQAGCDLELLGTRDVCSHRRAWHYYQESVKNPEAFVAIKCSSSDAFNNSSCESEKAFMGFSMDTGARGNFYLSTHPNPFKSSLGIEGLKNQKLIIITNDGVSEGSLEIASPFLAILDERNSHGGEEETSLENF